MVFWVLFQQTNKQTRGWRLSEQKEGGIIDFVVPKNTRAQKKPSPDRMTQKSLAPVCVPDVIGALAAWRRNTQKKKNGLVRDTPWADFSVIVVQLCSTIIAIFHSLALSYKDCFLSRIIADYCRPQKRHLI